ncbi:MAG: hypothetical protein MJ219_00630 [Mycoplasmoidaceae bacterium]|nr:hypothetical protein [Mycoplasmoidaceae bacterium]
MRKIHLLMPTILVASSIPMVSMVGCNKNNGPIIKGQLTFTATEDCKFMIYADEFLET